VRRHGVAWRTVVITSVITSVAGQQHEFGEI